MRVVVVLICCALALAAPSARAQAALGKLPRVQISGREYVRLRDWTKANKFQVRWLKPGSTVEISRGDDRLVLVANSAVAFINGIKVWLSHPVTANASVMYVSSLDLQTTIQPLVFPAKSSGAKIKLIALDPGHGGRDTGNRVGTQAEKIYTLLLAQEIREQLKPQGIKVVLTRATDTFVDLPERPAKARRLNADMFVSLHFNASAVERNEVRGSEVYCHTPVGASSTNSKGVGADSGSFAGNRFNSQNILLAYELQKSLTRKLGVPDRGVRRARFQVLREATMPAVLIEAGFMSHPVEGRKIFDPAYRRQMARAIVDGILTYKMSVER